MHRFLLLIAVLLLSPLQVAPAFAVQPDEIMADPVLEARARAISRNLRCPVCQSESIDDSDAPISRDLRLVVRERLSAGDSDDAVIDFVVARYGEYVLFNPRPQGSNLLLWLAGPTVLLISAGSAFIYLRRRSRAAPAPDRLSPEEEARLAEILAKAERDTL